METLTVGKGGPDMARPSLVGWVYWNRLRHLAQSKVKVTAADGLQLVGSMECQALQEVAAYENLREALNTRSSRRPDAGSVPARLAAGPVAQADQPTPMFADLQRRAREAWQALEADGRPRILVGMATCGRSAGAAEVLETLRPRPTRCFRPARRTAGEACRGEDRR